MKKLYRYLPLILVFGLIVYFTIEAYATSTGRIMRTSTVDGGCGSSTCHANTPSTNTTVSLTAGSLTVEPGSTNSYTIRVSNSTLNNTGINIAFKTSITGAANIGTVGAPSGSGLQVLVNELTHSSPKDLISGSTDFSFTWQAPDKPGKYYLRAAGLAGNNNSSASGDEWNFMTPLEVIVRGVEIKEPVAGTNACTGKALNIKWESAGIEDLKIELSSDGGNSWNITLQESFKAVGGVWTWNIPTDFQQGNKFRIRLSDVTDPNRKSEMTANFGIFGQFYITKHPESKPLCPGESLQLYVNTQGQGLTYQWRKNGALIPGATDSILNLNNVNLGSSGFYGVIVSSSCFSPIISDEANIDVRIPTVITTQPQTQNVCLGGTAVFQVEADAHTIKYQWVKGNKDINGATSKTLTLTKVSGADVSTYYCEISGFCGTVRTNVVSLAINSQPVITLQPLEQIVCEKVTVTFKIEATGLDNIYEWYFNDKKVSTVSSPEYKLTNVNLVNAGTYHCIVRNNCGQPVKSNSVQLTVNPLPKITSQPQARSVMVGDMVEFAVSAQNVNTYQWKKNGKNIPDAVESSYKIDSAVTGDAGDYECTITNDCGSVTTIKAKLVVNVPLPGPRVSFTSLTIDFGDIFSDKSLDSLLTGFIKNNGTDTLLIDSIRIVTPDTTKYFELIFEDSTELDVNESIDISLKFTPFTPGAKSAKLVVYSNAVGEVPFVNLIGDGAVWDMATNRSKIDFGDVLVGQSDSVTFRIFNQSDYDIAWDNLEFDCDADNNFSIVKPELPVIVKSKTSQDVTAAFNPENAGNYNCLMSMVFYGTDKKLNIELKGVGTGSSVNSDLYISDFNVFPNPSDRNLVFEFRLKELSDYTIDIIDNQGKIVRSHSGENPADKIIFLWDGNDNSGSLIPNGSYVAVLRAGNTFKTLNIVLIR